MNKPHLIYFADPMCSWCWGFSPVIDAIQTIFGERLPIKLIMGGLRPGNNAPMDIKEKNDIRHHWEHVHEASNQPFDFDFFKREQFVYDTEPAARAVIILRRQSPQLGMAALKAIQQAFYAHNQDVTDVKVLADIAQSLGMDKQIFIDTFLSQDAQEETWADFSVAQHSGVRGFPTLAAGTLSDQPYTLITHGFQPTQSILPILTKWFEKEATTA